MLRIAEMRDEYVRDVTEFNSLLTRSVTVERGLKAYCQRADWTPEERARASKALDDLDWEDDHQGTPAEIRRIWSQLAARRADPALQEAARGGKGPGMPGAGTQSHEDCAVYALATAAGVPYSVAAARVTALIRDEAWRPAAERSDPQGAIERGGLNGGEVIVLAEALGQVEVVRRAQLDRVLDEGRPVIVNVASATGGAPAVVLNRRFPHRGENWYEVIDSNRAPLQRLYLRAAELATIQNETAIAFRPEPGSVVRPLR